MDRAKLAEKLLEIGSSVSSLRLQNLSDQESKEQRIGDIERKLSGLTDEVLNGKRGGKEEVSRQRLISTVGLIRAAIREVGSYMDDLEDDLIRHDDGDTFDLDRSINILSTIITFGKVEGYLNDTYGEAIWKVYGRLQEGELLRESQLHAYQYEDFEEVMLKNAEDYELGQDNEEEE